MMKNTQKKLKAKHFRYLSKENIENPMDYLNEFYCGDLKLEHWLTDINTLLTTSVNIEMKSSIPIGMGKTIRCLIEQVEFGYLIFKKLELKKQAHPLDFYKSKIDFENFKNNGTITLDGKEAYLDTISKFFSYLNLKDWLSTLDMLWINLTEREKTVKGFDSIGEDRIVTYQELLKRLAIALHRIYEIGKLPEYDDSTHQRLETNERIIAEESDQYTDQVIDINKYNNRAEPEKSEIHPDDLYTKKIIKQLRNRFGEDDLETWQSECQSLHIGLDNKYYTWNEAFKDSHLGSTFYFCAIIHKIIKFVGEEVSTICNPNKFSFKPIDTPQACQQFIHKNRTTTLRYLSLSEILQPEYYLYQLFEELPNYEWENKFNEIIEIYLSLDNNESFFGNGGYLKFLQQVQKCIELSYLIAFKDEIEFVDILTLENQEM